VCGICSHILLLPSRTCQHRQPPFLICSLTQPRPCSLMVFMVAGKAAYRRAEGPSLPVPVPFDIPCKLEETEECKSVDYVQTIRMFCTNTSFCTVYETMHLCFLFVSSRYEMHLACSTGRRVHLCAAYSACPRHFPTRCHALCRA
jgi:hypothetical protein